jgi:hypothetical protein
MEVPWLNSANDVATRYSEYFKETHTYMHRAGAAEQQDSRCQDGEKTSIESCIVCEQLSKEQAPSHNKSASQYQPHHEKIGE